METLRQQQLDLQEALQDEIEAWEQLRVAQARVNQAYRAYYGSDLDHTT